VFVFAFPLLVLVAALELGGGGAHEPGPPPEQPIAASSKAFHPAVRIVGELVLGTIGGGMGWYAGGWGRNACGDYGWSCSFAAQQIPSGLGVALGAYLAGRWAGGMGQFRWGLFGAALGVIAYYGAVATLGFAGLGLFFLPLAGAVLGLELSHAAREPTSAAAVGPVAPGTPQFSFAF
jgi:hypothetical protein